MKTILVVDDMAVFREPITVALRQCGFQTVAAGDGIEALAVLRREVVDLILLDVNMPRMDGLAFLRQMQQLGPPKNASPVILLTAVCERDQVIEAARLGVRDYMLKSQFSLKELQSRVEKKLNSTPSAPPAPPAPVAKAAPVTPQPNAEATAPVLAPSPPIPPASPPPAAVSLAMGETPGVDPNATALDALRSIKPILLRSQIDERLETCGELKALSPTVARVIRMTTHSDCSIDTIAAVVRQDQAMALRILKVANSVMYTRGEPVECVSKAVMRIGLSQVRSLAMNIAVIDSFDSRLFDGILDLRLFWEHCIGVGLIAGQIARLRGAGDSEIESAFTGGLLHDVGRLVFAEQFPDHYRQVMRTAVNLKLPLDQVESRMMLVNHADLMDKLLHAWRFPQHLVNPVALHHLGMGNIRALSPRSVAEPATLALANRLAHAMLLGCSGNETIYPLDDFVAALNLRDSDVLAVEDVIRAGLDDMKFAMLSTDCNRIWPDTRAAARRQLKSPLRALYAGAVSTTDAYRLITRTLSDETSGEPPNLAVVHIRHVRDRGPVSLLLREAEAKAGVGPLPAVILSPKANLLPENSIMTGRNHLLLPTPTALNRYIDAVNRMLAPKELS